jgi:hypothetical protein
MANRLLQFKGTVQACKPVLPRCPNKASISNHCSEDKMSENKKLEKITGEAGVSSDMSQAGATV